MSSAISRLVIIAAVCLLLALSGCEGDRFEPHLPTGATVTVADPPVLDVYAMAGRSFDDLVVLVEQTAIMGHGPDGWTNLGSDWLGSLRLIAADMGAGGDLVVCDQYGRVFVRRDDLWTELPPLASVSLDDVALDRDGSVWVCGRSELFLPLLAHWDGAAWSLHQPPEQNTGLYRIVVAGPGDVVVDGSRGLVFRFRDGQWEQPGVFTEVWDLWAGDDGEVYAAWLQRVGRLTDDGFEPLDDREFPETLEGIAGNAHGHLAVAWRPGQVAVRRDGAWTDLPQATDEDGNPFTAGRLLLLDDGAVVATPRYSGRMYRFDGESWSPLRPSPPPLRAIVPDRISYGGSVYWQAVGAEGIEIDIHDSQPRYMWAETLGERLDVIDRALLANGEQFHITAAGHWMARIGNERVGSTVPAPHPYRAVAAGTAGEVVIVGDAGLVQWGVNGIQYTDGPGLATDLLAICSSPADTSFWVVGDAGTIARRRADHTWTVHAGATTADLAAVWARDAADVYVAGSGGTVLAWDGAVWRDLECPLTTDLTSVMGSSGRYLWVCGTAGALAVHDGDRWREIDSGYAGDLIDLALQNFRQAVVLTDDGSLLGCTVLDP